MLATDTLFVETRMRRLLTLALPALLIAAAPAPKPLTPNDIVAAAPRSAWRPIAPDDLVLVDLEGGARVIIQLAPTFAPVHVANIRLLAKSTYWQGAAVYRVQDNYVAQWGIGDVERPIPVGVIATPPAEYTRSLKGLAIRPMADRDAYAAKIGHTLGWPIAYDPRTGRANLTHCYATVGVARDLAPDTGSGGELYAIIGHAPRQLDRNIAIVGRVIEGIEALSALPRGTEALGFYKDGLGVRPISRIRLVSSLAATERPSFEYLSETSASFGQYLRLRANRQDDFYRTAAGGVDLCNAPVPVRRTPKA